MKLNAKQYAQAWYQQLTAVEATQWETISQAVLNEIVRRGDMKLLPDITRRVEDMYYAANNLTPVTVTTAQALPQSAIHAAVEKFIPLSRAAVQTVADKRLIGGVKVETRNQRWDMSLKKQLDQLANSLTQ